MRRRVLAGLGTGCVLAMVLAGAPAQAASKEPRPQFGVAALDGTPVRWNPCVAHTFSINPGGMPPGEVRRVVGAMSAISKASGVPWTYSGPTAVRVTDEIADDSGLVREQTGTEVLISFQDPAPDAGTVTARVANPRLDYSPSRAWDWLESGYLVVNRPEYAKVPPALRSAFLQRQLLPLMNITASAQPGAFVRRELSASMPLGPSAKRALAAVGAAGGCGRAPGAPSGFTANPADATISWSAQPATDTRIDWIAEYHGEASSPVGSLAIDTGLDEFDVSSLLADSGETAVTITVRAESYAGVLGPSATATVVFPPR